MKLQSWLKSRVKNFHDEWLLYVISIVGILILWVFVYVFVDYTGGKIIIVEGEVIGHRYKPSHTDQRFDVVPIPTPDGGTENRIEYSTQHVDEAFYLIVMGPDGPREYSVDAPLYIYYQKGDAVPIQRLIGKYSHTCLSSWISQ
ncbi:hypothetical protein BWI93_10240 [Siphonobacter sp. BAB-5385]|uniref:hypothetical protein n=1 Tax=Siphonobacter sp. BAB-5385 TaxID=1864822 RepID=UPI000B9DEC90|nr:hypothetical protein [Siphonobacter sp. BAB-5385]OZI08237.1 hypothetical protein BWI93_10240 [Siphonobacter sp. BAB-5385]